MTLHEAIETILIEKGPLNTSDIAFLINERHLYVRGDGEPVKASQISARINHYETTFERLPDGRISLITR